MFILYNIQDGEDVHQRCLLVTGKCASSKDDEDYVQVDTANEFDRTTFPAHRWPLCGGWFKCLVLLSPGKNVITFTIGQEEISTKVSINYVPLLNTPPLHLAIMVAKDSPLLIDCPLSKFGSVSSAHSTLEAAVAKLRMTACMWQALTAEEMRSAGLGRRSFRLEEEWGVDTLSRSFLNNPTAVDSMRSTVKVHIVRVDKTVADIRDLNKAQQNERGGSRDELHNIFSNALKAHGAPFISEARPVVAGLILDSHFDLQSNIILGHAALGAHDLNGLSLGIFGSHLAYSWPRFLEEVPDCLLDTKFPGDIVGNDNGECATNWEACAVGQGAFLHEVGHAFSAPHTTGIMARGYSRDWAKCFLSTVAYSGYKKRRDNIPITKDTQHDCHWDLEDMLRFLNLPHFQHPSDIKRSRDTPTVSFEDDDDFPRIIIRSEAANIGLVKLGSKIIDKASVSSPVQLVSLNVNELEDGYDRKTPLQLHVLSMNGNHTKSSVWSLLTSKTYFRVPRSNIRLEMKCSGQPKDETDRWNWAVMLKKRNSQGGLSRAYKIDLRVGCWLDGAEVYYEDGTVVPCGPRGEGGDDPEMGGHQSRKLVIPKNVEIAKVMVTNLQHDHLQGLRMVLSNGKAMGALNGRSDGSVVDTLVPKEGHKIVGFYGSSGPYADCNQFGIITAPRNVELPDYVYDLPELQNNPKDESDGGHRSKRRKMSHRMRSGDDDSQTESNDLDTSEDEDDDYDYSQDKDVF